MHRTIACLGACLLVVLASCGSDNGLTLAPVRGTITYKGEPITYGTIMFEPDVEAGNDGPPAIGTINKDGSFVLSTEESGDGAVVGAHRVAIIGLDPEGKPPAKAMPDPTVDPKGFMIAKTQAGMAPRSRKAEEPTYTDKDGKVFRYTAPAKLANPNTSDIKVKVAGGSNSITLEIDDNGQVTVKH